MKIAHIFNAIDSKNQNDSFLDYQPFEVDYIKNIIEQKDNNQKLLKEVSSEYDKLYNEALYPTQDNLISKYDKEKLDALLNKLGDDILMISGDFWGIQKFIFEDLTTNKASKILRSRSAMVELITYVVVEIIKDEFKDSKEVLFGAGKFLMLAKKENNYQDRLDNIQKELDNYFLRNFFGQNGFVLSHQETTKQRLSNQNDDNEMKDDLIALGNDNEKRKLNKFKLFDIEEDKINIDLFEGVKNDDDICEFCKKRVKERDNACKVCLNQIALGEKLTKKQYMKIEKTQNKKDDDILIFEYQNSYFYAKFFDEIDDLDGMFDITNNRYDEVAKWPIGSFVAKNNGKIKSFEELQKGSQGLIAMKADVDRLGNTFRDFYMSSFKKFNRLSRELNFFFSTYIPYFIEQNQKYKDNVYVVFAGGDDLFVVGEYQTMIELTKDVREQFYRFSLEKSTLSVGLVMFKHSTPISYISHLADEAEKRAKNVVEDNQNRDGIDLFGISMKFDRFLSIEKKWQKIVKKLEDLDIDTTTFYYRLLELCDMRENLNDNIKNAMWKSKLSYIFKRNLSKLDNDSYLEISKLIEDNGKRLKPLIYLTIYGNRKI